MHTTLGRLHQILATLQLVLSSPIDVLTKRFLLVSSLRAVNVVAKPQHLMKYDTPPFNLHRGKDLGTEKADVDFKGRRP